MSASKILQEVYRSHIDHFGEPDNSWTFDDGKKSAVYPDRIDVLVWSATADCEMTTFSTIGMSDRKMNDAAHRAELHWGLRLKPEKKDEALLARFLANLAMYPFQIQSFIDWWHTLAEPGAIPLHSEAVCVLFHPRFVSDGWDTVATSAGEVRILNVIPITRKEKDLKSRALIVEALNRIDMFSPR